MSKKALAQSKSFTKLQKIFLVLSALIPCIVLVVQIITLGFMGLNPPPPPPTPEPSIHRFIDMLTPIMISLFMCIMGFVTFAFLLRWKKKTDVYSSQEKSFRDLVSTKSPETSEADDIQYITLTELQYQNISYMRKMRIISYISIFIGILYLWWSLRGLLVTLGILLPQIPTHPIPIVLNVVNLTSQIILSAYIIFQWVVFRKWNRKLEDIEKYEKKIHDEIG